MPAAREYYAPVRPLVAIDARPDEGLDIADVTGRKHLDYGYGRTTVAAENAAAALEVMSRFALDPATLVWLPPTMAPCSSSAVDGYLEHPTAAFADLRGAGITTVVCEEKHMGSRAVVRISRTGAGDAIWTRTGRPFFGAELDAPLLARVRAAAAGLFAELDSDWLLLDTELLPWSAKAAGLIRERYAGVGAAGRAALPAALTVLDQVAGRGLDVTALRERIELRSAEIAGYSAA